MREQDYLRNGNHRHDIQENRNIESCQEYLYSGQIYHRADIYTRSRL